jgi:hypothetical protein
MARKIIKYLLVFILAFILIVFLVLFTPALWRHWFTYPQLDKQVNDFQKLRKETVSITKLNTFRGILHVHSYLSHDSEGTLSDIIPAAKNGGIDFIFLTDHPRSDIDTFPHGYKGYYDGVLIEPGSEKQGFVTWPLDSAIIDWKVDKNTIAENIVSRGGLIFYSHTEEPHNWDNPDYQGMEIYNFHTDTKDESLTPLIINFIVNGNKYRHWALREVFDEQPSILAIWDSLNSKRKIVGFSATDTHENQNIRARYLNDGRVEWVGPNANVIDTMEVKLWNKWLFHQPDENGWIYKWMIDTYKSGFNYITNYLLADTLTVPSLADHLKKGHIYSAFKCLGDAKGFMYYCINQDDSIGGILGDSINLDQIKTLNATSPLPGQFRLIHNGTTVDVSSSESYQYTWGELIEKGSYRIEMHIKLKGRYVPWIYSNPIYIY